MKIYKEMPPVETCYKETSCDKTCFKHAKKISHGLKYAQKHVEPWQTCCKK